MNEAIIEKLRKVLALAGRGATEGEMQAAMARAKEIAMKHNIDLTRISLEDPASKKAKIDVTRENVRGVLKSKYWRKHHIWISQIVKEVFEVKTIRSTSRRGSREELNYFFLVGESGDIVMATMVLQWLDKLFPELLRQQVHEGRLLDDNASAHGYYSGLCTGILEVNKKKEAEVIKETGTDANKYALVLRAKEELIVDKFNEFFPQAKTSKPRIRDMSAAAYGMGYKKGKTIRLNQVGAGKAHGQIS